MHVSLSVSVCLSPPPRCMPVCLSTYSLSVPLCTHKQVYFFLFLNKTLWSQLEQTFFTDRFWFLNILLKSLLNSRKSFTSGVKQQYKSVWRQRTQWHLFYVFIFPVWCLSRWPTDLFIWFLEEFLNLRECDNWKETGMIFKTIWMEPFVSLQTPLA